MVKNGTGKRSRRDLGFTFSGGFKEHIRQYFMQEVWVFRCPSATNGGRGIPVSPCHTMCL